ncbi:MAG: hypothetical protein M1833_004026 [Piccolia ochrophora]|nr:MAG: hypothetical protein M1833_004026 [Piccolia ochrophora]
MLLDFSRTVLLCGLTLPLAWAKPAAYEQSGNARSCCKEVERSLGSLLYYPEAEQYKSSLDSYWSDQASSLKPNCIVTPKNTKDVSKAVKTLVKNPSCKFAIRSGGHTAWAGSNNIDGGVTIDLQALNGISLSKDKAVASIGPGARWGQVYTKLDTEGVAVVGGRVETVGVGGLIMGGGSSFFSPRYGLACDSVKNFEVVLAAGEVTDVNEAKHPDLFRALKGGSNNLALVTRFDVFAFRQGNIWGGTIVTPFETVSESTDAFVDFTDSMDKDPYAAYNQFWSYNATDGQSSIIHLLGYTKPVVDPAPYKKITAIKPQLANTMQVASLGTVVHDISPKVYPAQNLFITTTFQNTADNIAQAWKISSDVMKPLQSDFQVFYYPWPRRFADLGRERGGNVLGLERFEKNNVVVLLSLGWSDPADNNRFDRAANEVIRRLDAYTRRKGTATDYIYLNYANKGQDPIGAYGKENVRLLKKVAQKFDPSGVFQRQVPGGFKL